MFSCAGREAKIRLGRSTLGSGCQHEADFWGRLHVPSINRTKKSLRPGTQLSWNVAYALALVLRTTFGLILCSSAVWPQGNSGGRLAADEF